jgi:hypothetical protein
MKSIVVTVTTSPTLVVAADNFARHCYLHSSSGSLYIGGSNVTSANGLHMANNTTLEIFVPTNETIYAISASSTHTMRVLTPDLDL